MPARPEVGGTHPAFDGSEDVFDGTAPNRHRVGHRIEPALHFIEHRFVLPPSDTLLLPGCARGSGCEGTAGLLVEVHADEFAAFHPGEAFLELRAGRTAIGAGLRLMHEHGFAPKARA